MMCCNINMLIIFFCLIVIPATSSRQNNLAQSAAEEARAAHNAQVEAGHQAAHIIKKNLAEKAVAAARAAEAALAGKEAYLAEIHREKQAVNIIVQKQRESKAELERMGNSTSRYLGQLQEIMKEMSQADQLAQASKSNERSSLEVLRAQLDEKCKELEAARESMEKVCSDLISAQEELKVTQEATKKAIQQADEARKAASRDRRSHNSQHFRSMD